MTKDSMRWDKLAWWEKALVGLYVAFFSTAIVMGLLAFGLPL